jgi:hypothetical protein
MTFSISLFLLIFPAKGNMRIAILKSLNTFPKTLYRGIFFAGETYFPMPQKMSPTILAAS